jgi:flagellar hook-basal body complex protein FliE
MSDPLGLIRNTGSTGGVNMPRSGAQPQINGPSFKDVLMDNLKEVNKLQQDASKAIEDGLTGNRNDIEGVVSAVQKADTAFRMLQSVRNKVIEAYDELKQVRV